MTLWRSGGTARLGMFVSQLWSWFHNHNAHFLHTWHGDLLVISYWSTDCVQCSKVTSDCALIKEGWPKMFAEEEVNDVFSILRDFHFSSSYWSAHQWSQNLFNFNFNIFENATKICVYLLWKDLSIPESREETLSIMLIVRNRACLTHRY